MIETITNGEPLVNWFQFLLGVVVFLGGLAIHYVKTETMQNERSKLIGRELKRLNDWLDNHERKFEEIRCAQIQPTGVTTYMLRAECDVRFSGLQSSLQITEKEMKRKAEIYHKCTGELEQRLLILETKFDKLKEKV